ncbi:hypothetical protein LJB77_01505 [Ruminococcaceae bacterium OttesenSCG-928-N02]|nr:hypothetical protein [Ruminococcaceae bacterium OttesenSCG-928-N02]
MSTIYIDENFRCYLHAANGLRAVQTDVFDGKCRAYVEAHHYIPAGEVWVRGNATFHGEMLCTAQDYHVLAALQCEAAQKALSELGLPRGRAMEEGVQTLRTAITSAANYLPDDIASTCAALFESWQPGTLYKAGARIQHAGSLYKCLQEHTSQADWSPPLTPGLWVPVINPDEEWPLIANPISPENPYMEGQKGRTPDGRRWRSLIDFNIWQPSDYPTAWQAEN